MLSSSGVGAALPSSACLRSTRDSLTVRVSSVNIRANVSHVFCRFNRNSFTDKDDERTSEADASRERSGRGRGRGRRQGFDNAQQANRVTFERL